MLPSPSIGWRLKVVAPAQIFVLEDEFAVRTVIVEALTDAVRYVRGSLARGR